MDTTSSIHVASPADPESVLPKSVPLAGVRAWKQSVLIPTYAPAPPDPHPMFLENRVYQGCSGRVYPNPITERISPVKTDRLYSALFLENEYVKLMVLPELGGRIHSGLDKTSQYNFFYRQPVIKPALMGLFGPWVSGGVEFSFPQHHHPSAFQPVHYAFDELPDGGMTIWLGEHEPMERMQGLWGITLSPGKSLIEIKVRLFNRTRLAQPFLWWVNIGVPVHNDYQVFYPPDAVHAGHLRPGAQNALSGIDLRSGADIRWGNIHSPTSFLAASSRFDFIGGFDHRLNAGMITLADHRAAPGKKFWSWGNSEVGRAWEHNLTDGCGPYGELMQGAFSDHQPEFSTLQPYESRGFSHFVYPIQQIGPVKNANRRLAVNLEAQPGRILAGICSSERIPAHIVLQAGGNAIWEADFELAPGRSFMRETPPQEELAIHQYVLKVLDRDGRELIRYQPRPPKSRESGVKPAMIVAASECDGVLAAAGAIAPAPPAQVITNDELFTIGVQLEQLRHATRSPETYWQEALRRDAGDARSNVALGRLRLRQGFFEFAVSHLKTALARLANRATSFEAGEAFYYLGAALNYLGDAEQAGEAYYHSIRSAGWRAAGCYSLAELDASRGDLSSALEHLDQALAADNAHRKARNLKAALLRRLGRHVLARRILERSLAANPLDLWSRNEDRLLLGAGEMFDGLLLQAAGAPDSPSGAGPRPHSENVYADIQLCLDVAFDYAAAGLWQEALDILRPHCQSDRPRPMALYASGYFANRQGNPSMGLDKYQLAAQAPADYCSPGRLEEMLVLEAALKAMPYDPRTHYYLGNFYFDRQRREDAARHWKQTTILSPSFAIAWRNLAIAEYRINLENKRATGRVAQVRKHDAEKSLPPHEQEMPLDALWIHANERVRDYANRALEAAPDDARLLEELDQLDKRLAMPPARRLERLEKFPDLIFQRDALVLEWTALLILLDRSQAALEKLAKHSFHPWEGSRGMAARLYVAAHLRLSQSALLAREPAAALEICHAACRIPENLGESLHPLIPLNQLDYQMALAHHALGESTQAWSSLARASAPTARPSTADYWRVLALRSLGRQGAALECLTRLSEHARWLRAALPEPDFFAASVPDFSAFPEDLAVSHAVEADLLTGLSHLGQERKDAARAAFERALRLDPSHLETAEAMRLL